LRAQFARSAFAPRRLQLGAGEERTEEFKFSTTGTGLLKASLDGQDALRLDDEASLELPESGLLRVAVITNRADLWQPLLESNSRVQALYFTPGAYRFRPDADVVLLDGFGPDKQPELPSLWVMPPLNSSPVRVVSVQEDALLTNWYTEHETGAGLRSKELPLSKVEVFARENDVVPVAGSNRGPVVVARPAKGQQPRVAVVGFDPLQGAVRFEVSTPLLFANLLRWLEPDRFRQTELMAAAVGMASLPLESGEGEGQFRVTDDNNRAVPFTVHRDSLQLYTSKPGVVRVVSPDRERVLSLTLPGVAEFEWKPPAAAGDPPSVSGESPGAIDLWKWLAIAGALGLLSEWLFFGHQARSRGTLPSGAASRDSRRDHDLVHQ
jgi:hypothetical protein